MKAYLSGDESASQTPIGQLHKGDKHEDEKFGCYLRITCSSHGLKGGHRYQGKAGDHLSYERAMEQLIVLLDSAARGNCEGNLKLLIY